MIEAAKRHLYSADDEEHWECPPGFPYEAEMERVIALQPQIEQVLGQQLTLDADIQDAASFAALAWRTGPRAGSKHGVAQVILTYVGIDFSAFGRIVAIWGNVPEAPLQDKIIEELGAVLRAADYYPIPEELLDAPYDGRNQFKSEIRTWGDRYFGYC